MKETIIKEEIAKIIPLSKDFQGIYQNVLEIKQEMLCQLRTEVSSLPDDFGNIYCYLQKAKEDLLKDLETDSEHDMSNCATDLAAHISELP